MPHKDLHPNTVSMFDQSVFEWVHRIAVFGVQGFTFHCSGSPPFALATLLFLAIHEATSPPSFLQSHFAILFQPHLPPSLSPLKVPLSPPPQPPHLSLPPLRSLLFQNRRGRSKAALRLRGVICSTPPLSLNTPSTCLFLIDMVLRCLFPSPQKVLWYALSFYHQYCRVFIRQL